MTALYDKTEKGREEIATRKYQLSTRMRSLLLVIDGKHDTDDTLAKLKSAGLDEDSLRELLEQGFIRRIESPVAQAEPAAVPVPPLEEHGVSDAEQYQALYRFFSETIKSTIGLRGYALQLKVERAASIEDFRALREPYLKAVEKAKGREMVYSLGERLDRLLSQAHAS